MMCCNAELVIQTPWPKNHSNGVIMLKASKLQKPIWNPDRALFGKLIIDLWQENIHSKSCYKDFCYKKAIFIASVEPRTWFILYI